MTGGQYNMVATVCWAGRCLTTDTVVESVSGILLHVLPPRSACKHHVEDHPAVSLDWMSGRRMGNGEWLWTMPLSRPLAHVEDQVTTCAGAVQSYHGLLVARIMLGLTEAGKLTTCPRLIINFTCSTPALTAIDRLLSCGRLSCLVLVLSFRSPDPNRHLLLRCLARRRIFRSLGLCDQHDGRCRRRGRLAMDLQCVPKVLRSLMARHLLMEQPCGS